MSELIDNARIKKNELKQLILELHKGSDPSTVRKKIADIMGEVPYGYVVEVEQELISEGLPTSEVLDLCDIHGEVLKGQINLENAKSADPGHPVHTFMQENRALEEKCDEMRGQISRLDDTEILDEAKELLSGTRPLVVDLLDVDKHYRKKEHLVFPYLEKNGISGPPTVMWGKHDQVRDVLKKSLLAIDSVAQLNREEIRHASNTALKAVVKGVEDMIFKEENILFPMCLDTLTDVEWFEVYRQAPEIGFCLIDPSDEWKPSEELESPASASDGDRVHLPSGSMTVDQLTAILNTLPFDLTFVDQNDTVRYFTQGNERIFDRNRAILGRKVQFCHPPSSVHVVQQIVDDFKSGKQDRAAFWINLHGTTFVHIEYFALRDDGGKYLGTLEVSQDLTEKRKLEGERRLLSYDTPSAES